ncbi:MAG: peptidase M75 [Bacteroidales bacterium]|jgi:predicted lipoprotein|nr:peptidase M75 [Bacteroidales bacterium]
MKKLKNLMLVAMACFALVSLFSCERGNSGDGDDAEMLEILDAYTNNTVIKTYGLLADKAIELLELCEDLQNSPTDAKVQVAAEKWIDARKYWEQSEAFLYGPAEYYALDPRIDSWPLDKNTLDQQLAGDMTNVDAAFVRDYYGVNLIGFHAIEYVLFEDGQSKAVSKITENELIYLVAVSEVLMEDCILLEAAWNQNLSSAKKRILDDAELEVSSNFGYEMLNAGSAGSRFKTPQQAVYEIIGGCETIADEVGNEKIADPYETGNVLRVESWYSWNSLTDFTDNIVSIENSYLGGMEGSRTGKSLSEYVKSKNTKLDTDILAAIDDAINAIQAIPAPFRNQLNNPASAKAIEDAMDACNALMDQLSLIYDVIE